MSESTNLFALLGGDDGDDIQQLAAKAAPLIKQEAAAPAPAKAAAPAKADAPGRGDGAGRGGRGGRGEGRGGRGGRGPRAPRGDQPNGVVAEDAGEEGRGDGGRGRARPEGGRGRGRGPAGARAPRREYERRDGTGRAHEPVKRGGAGAHNWGTETEEGAKAEAAPEAAPVAEYVVEGGEEAAEEAPAAEPAAAAEPVPEPEPEKPELTLEEYEKQLAEKRAALNKVAEVKAVSLDDFKGMKTYVRKEVEETIPGLEISKRKEPKAKDTDNKENKPKKQIAVLETGFQIKDSNADAPRGGRGAGRGGRGARGDRGDRPASGRGGRGGEGRGPRPAAAQGPRSTVQLAINDDAAFPSLG